jgi:hypothetical protein
MRRMLEFVRAALVVSAVPAVVLFYLSSSRTWIFMLVYVVAATIALVVLNHVLKESPDETIKAPSEQSK